MKQIFFTAVLITAMCFTSIHTLQAQAQDRNFVHVTRLKIIWPEDGSMRERDSLLAIVNQKTIIPNEYILSHREYTHLFTSDSKDYMIISEYKDYASWEKANERSDELWEKGWATDAERDAINNKLDTYFEQWHGDAIFSSNPKLSKN